MIFFFLTLSCGEFCSLVGINSSVLRLISDVEELAFGDLGFKMVKKIT